MTFALLYTVYYFSTFDLRQLTSRLPDSDRIEVQTLNTRFESIKGVVATTEVTGPQARELMNIWHTQSYVYEGDVMCHAPGYRMRFYRNGSQLIEVTICFNCHNIYFYKGGAAYRQVILGSLYSMSHSHQDASPKLHAFLDKLFPNPKDQPIHSDLP